jgi:hypothetical protein
MGGNILGWEGEGWGMGCGGVEGDGGRGRKEQNFFEIEGPPASDSWRNLENKAVSSLHKLLWNRLVRVGEGEAYPPPTYATTHTHNL